MTSTTPAGSHTAPPPAQPDGDFSWDGMADVVGRLDHHAGDDPHQRTLRILKFGEKFGEATGAWIGVQNQHPP